MRTNNMTSGNRFKQQAQQKFGKNWLHVLSKASSFSEKFIADLLERTGSYGLHEHHEKDLRIAFDADLSIINSRFEITEIVEDYRSGDINYLVIKFDDSEISLDFYKGKKIPTIEDCENYFNHQRQTGPFIYLQHSREKNKAKSVESWQSVLQACKDEEIDFLSELQAQLDYLNEAIVYRAPSRLNRACSIQSMKNSARRLYEDRSQNSRYIQVSAHNTENLTFIV